MKFLAIAAFLLSSPALAAQVDKETSKEIIQGGEVIGARPYAQPVPGFQLLIRHGGNLYICHVNLETRFGYNGDPNVDFVAVDRCISEDAD